jgi:hypothetical protein
VWEPDCTCVHGSVYILYGFQPINPSLAHLWSGSRLPAAAMHRFCGASINKVQSTVTAAMQVERASLGTLAPFKF